MFTLFIFLILVYTATVVYMGYLHYTEDLPKHLLYVYYAIVVTWLLYTSMAIYKILPAL